MTRDGWACDSGHPLVIWAKAVGQHCWFCGRFGRDHWLPRYNENVGTIHYPADRDPRRRFDTWRFE